MAEETGEVDVAGHAIEMLGGAVEQSTGRQRRPQEVDTRFMFEKGHVSNEAIMEGILALDRRMKPFKKLPDETRVGDTSLRELREMKQDLVAWLTEDRGLSMDDIWQGINRIKAEERLISEERIP